jgi:hypothetical protein
MSYSALVELTAKSQNDMDEILADIRILCTAMGIEFELLPEGG